MIIGFRIYDTIGTGSFSEENESFIVLKNVKFGDKKEPHVSLEKSKLQSLFYRVEEND